MRHALTASVRQLLIAHTPSPVRSALSRGGHHSGHWRLANIMSDPVRAGAGALSLHSSREAWAWAWRRTDVQLLRGKFARRHLRSRCLLPQTCCRIDGTLQSCPQGPRDCQRAGAQAPDLLQHSVITHRKSPLRVGTGTVAACSQAWRSSSESNHRP